MILKFLGDVVKSISAILAKGVRQCGSAALGGLVAKLMRQGGQVMVEGLVEVEELLVLKSLVVLTVVARRQGSVCELMVVNSWEVELLLPIVLSRDGSFEDINVDRLVWMSEVEPTSW